MRDSKPSTSSTSPNKRPAECDLSDQEPALKQATHHQQEESQLHLHPRGVHALQIHHRGGRGELETTPQNETSEHLRKSPMLELILIEYLCIFSSFQLVIMNVKSLSSCLSRSWENWSIAKSLCLPPKEPKKRLKTIQRFIFMIVFRLGTAVHYDSKIYLYDCVQTWWTQEKQKHSDRPAPGCCRILFTDELCQGQQHQALGQLYSSEGAPHWNYFYTSWIYLFSTNCLMSRSSALSPARFLTFCALTTLASSLSILSSSFSTGVRICSRHCPRCRQQHRLCSARRVQHPQCRPVSDLGQ